MLLVLVPRSGNWGQDVLLENEVGAIPKEKVNSGRRRNGFEIFEEEKHLWSFRLLCMAENQ